LHRPQNVLVWDVDLQYLWCITKTGESQTQGRLVVRLTGIIVIFVALVAVFAVAQDEGPWFDMKNCGFCKEISNQSGLMEHMHTDYQNISNGIVSVTTIDDGYWEKYEAAEKGMEKVADGFQKGEIPQMCNHCMKMGMFFMSGVKVESIKSGHTVVMIYQSSDSTQIAELQAFGKKNLEEYAKMMGE